MSTNENDILALIRARRAAVGQGGPPQAGGATPASISARRAALGERSDESGFAMRPYQKASPDEEAVNAALERLGQRGGSSAGDFLRTSARIPTLGTFDEMRGGLAALMPGGDSYTEARDKERVIQEDIDLLSPEAAGLSKLAGAAAMYPLGAGVSGLSKLLGPAAAPASALRNIATAGGAGAALTGADHIGRGEGSFTERAQGAGWPMVGGAVMGALPVAAIEGAGRFVTGPLRGLSEARNLGKTNLSAIREEIDQSLGGLDKVFSDKSAQTADLFAKRQAALVEEAAAMSEGVSEGATRQLADRSLTAGERLAAKVREAKGITEPVDVAMAKAEQGKKLVGELRYQPIEARGPITSPRIKALLETPEFARDVRAVGIEPGVDPTLSQMQALRNRFRSGSNKDRQLFGRVDRLMKEDIEDLAHAADAPYAGFSGVRRQQDAATKAGNWDSAKIRTHLDSVTDDPAKNAFRETYVENNIVQRLRQRDTGAPYVEKLLAGGGEMDDRLRAVLDDDQFKAIQEAIIEERAAIAEITRGRQVDLSKIERQVEDAKQAIGLQEHTAQRALLGEKQGVRGPVEGLQRRAEGLATTQAELQASATRLASRIKRIMGAGLLTGAGYTGYRLGTMGLPELLP